MKTNYLFLLATFLYVSCGWSQERTVEDILNQKELPRPMYVLKTGVLQSLVINMTYGQDIIVSEPDKKRLQEAQVVSVDLVFTDFPKGAELKDLNKQRIEQIKQLRKDLVTNVNIPWRIIRQTACADESEAKVLFHGVVIHYRAKQDEATIMRDITLLNNLPTKGDSLESLVTKERPYGVKLADSTILKVMERNKNWDEMLIVADLTGSMSPYVSQLLIWFQLKMKDRNVKQVVFFNDGDNKHESKKVIGHIGGIYSAKTSSYDELLQLALKTIKAGGGGDAPENNCEALIEGIKSSPDAKHIILIADNLAPIKDIRLMDSISKPVHIILCGTEWGPISTDYLNLARKTGGSVHTMRDDLFDLMKLNEGEKVKIGKHNYMIVKGSLVLLTSG